MGGIVSSHDDMYVLRVIGEDFRESEAKEIDNYTVQTSPLVFETEEGRATRIVSSASTSGKTVNLHEPITSGNQSLNPASTFESKDISSKLSSKSAKLDFTPPPEDRRNSLTKSTKIKNLNVTCGSSIPWLITDLLTDNIPLESFEFGPILGKGATGTVFLTKYFGNKHCVLKRMKKYEVLNKHQLVNIQTEKSILDAIHSPFTVKAFGTFQDELHVYIAMEYLPGGNLRTLLQKYARFGPDMAKFYISELFLALEYLQSMDIVYRDLKPENVMIDAFGHVKLIDFDTATILLNKEDRMHTICPNVNPAYMAPEKYSANQVTGGYTHIVDWWSFGVLLYELLMGKTPFSSSRSNRDTHLTIYQNIVKNKIHFPQGFDAPSRSLITSLLQPIIAIRLTNPMLIRKHEYFMIPWDNVLKKHLKPPFIPDLTNGPNDTRYFPIPTEKNKGETMTTSHWVREPQVSEFSEF